MWSAPGWELLAVFAVASIVGGIFTGFARPLSRKLGIVDRPDGLRKTHEQPMPLLGGVAFFLTFLCVVVAVRLLKAPAIALADGTLLSSVNFAAMLVSGGLFCLIGLWDDRVTLRARHKLILQILATLPFVVWGHTFEAVSILGLEFHLGAVAGIATVVWLIGCVNIVNLMDGLDGLAGSLGTIVSVTLAMFAVSVGNYDMAAVALVLAGAIVGFLIHNWPPARIYLGDSGSMTIGFFVGVLALQTSMKMTTTFTLAVPVVLLSVPIFDTLMAILRRKLEGKSVGDADRRHIHHRLQDSGLTKAQALVVLAGLCLLMAAASVVSVFVRSDAVAVGTCVVILLTLIVGRVFGYDETVLLFRSVRAAASLVFSSPKLFRTRLILTRLQKGETPSPRELWETVCRQLHQIGCHEVEAVLTRVESLELRVESEVDSLDSQPTDRQTQTRIVSRSDSLPNDDGAQWQFRYSLNNDRDERLLLIATGGTSATPSLDKGGIAGQFADCCQLAAAFCQQWRDAGEEFTAFLLEAGERETPAWPVVPEPQRRAA